MRGKEFDLCVIGGGSGGLVAAAGAAQLGARVALVEKHALGGDCLWSGCVPSKALLQSAKVAQTQREAARFGLPPCAPAIDLARVMEHVDAVIRAIEPHDSPERFRALGVEVLFGEGRFLDARRFQLGDRTLTASHFLLATGARPAIPPIPGLEGIPYLTYESLFRLREPVPRLIVIGGGPIGIELAQAMRRLDSEVDLVHRDARILPREDAELSDIVAGRLRREGLRLHLQADIVRLEGRAGDIRLRIRTGDDERDLQASHLLVATGRQPNVEGLGLEDAGVAVEKGRVLTDARLRTTAPGIHACGDVTSPWQFTHMAEHQAAIVLQDTLFHLPVKARTENIPWCTFCDPELARVGLSAGEAHAQGIEHRVYDLPHRDLDRAQTDRETEGLTRLVTDPRGRLLGAAIAGPHAGELIHEFVLALDRGLKVADIARPIHVYPTLAQGNRRVAELRRKAALTPSARRWIQRIFRLHGN
ncbi:MAG: dihydrolipoyl dehydrogenase family protein [Pseudomonadota bacterium]